MFKIPNSIQWNIVWTILAHLCLLKKSKQTLMNALLTDSCSQKENIPAMLLKYEM